MTKPALVRVGGVLLLGVALGGCDAPQGDEPPAQKKAALTTTLFKPWVGYPTGSAPEAVAIGDLNADGRKDVAMVTSTRASEPNANTLHVFLQASDGTLQAPAKYPLGWYPQSVDVGDVNGDGRPDVVAGSNGDGIAVLLQNAAGTLDPMVRYATVRSLSVKIGDFNGDGRMDVAGLGNGGWGEGLAVFLQTAAGTLAAPVPYAVPHGGQDELEVGDLDGDGRTDLVVGNQFPYSAPDFWVLLQNANGTLAAPVAYAVPGNGVWDTTNGLGVGDTNGDGRADVIMSYGGNRPTTFIGRFSQNAQGTLDTPTAFGSYDIPRAVDVADVDSDGRKDVLVTHPGWLQLGVYRQAATGELGAEELYAIPYSAGDKAQSMAVGDVTGDGLPDVVLTDYNIVVGLVVLAHVDDVPPAVAVTAPTGGFRLAGVPLEVTWTASDNLGLAGFDVSVSLDAGSSYAPIAGCTALPAAARSCTWASPGPADASVRLRVVARDAAGNQGTADAAIDLFAPGIVVTAPAAGSVIQAGTTVNLTWNHNLPAGGTVRVELSRDGGASFATLAAAAPNTGSFLWLATGPVTADARVRVTSNGIAASGGSGAFAIIAGTVSVTAPVTGATWPIGTAQAITWTTNVPAGGTVRVELSRDGGATYVVLAAAAPNSGSFAWTSTAPATASAVVRVSANGDVPATGVSGRFALAAAALAVTAPAAGTTWAIGATRAVTWTSNLAPTGTVRIELSRNGGSSFTTLASSVANTGSFTWTASGSTTTSAVVRVSANGAPAASGVSGRFSLVTPTLSVTAPNTSVTWLVGSVHAITWTHNLGAGAPFKLEVSRNGGSSWSTIATSVLGGATSGSYDWTVPSPRSDTSRVRVTWTANTAVQDTSNASFKIR